MTIWTSIASLNTAVDSPITTSLMTALKNNPKALAEGDATSPGIEPKAMNSSTFRAYRSSNTTINTGSANGYQTIVCDTEVFDTDSDYDNSTGVYTPSAAGKYLVSATVRVDPSNTAMKPELAIYKNSTGVVIWTTIPGTTDPYTIAVTAIVDMNGTSDTLTMRVREVGTESTTLSITGDAGGLYTSFQAFQIGG